MGLVLLIILIILLTGGLPQWGFHPYGYGPSSLLATVLIILIILMILGRV